MMPEDDCMSPLELVFDHHGEQETNLEQAYKKAARVFAETVVLGNPADIMKKLEKCPLFRKVDLSDDGQVIFYESCRHRVNEMTRISLPINVKLKKIIIYEVEAHENK